MAKQGNRSTVSSGGGKIRLLWIDADLGGTEDVAQITQAIANALRPPTVQHSRLLGSHANPQDERSIAGGEEIIVTGETEDSSVTIEPESRVPSSPKPNKSRKGRDPKIVDDLDLTGNGISFAEYAKQKDPKHDSKRFLTVMAWFKNHGGRPAIGIDEVYTVYRTSGLGWSYNLADWGKVFRNLVQRDVAKRIGNGQYSINVAGEAALETEAE